MREYRSKAVGAAQERVREAGCQAFWNIPGDATYSGMRVVAEKLRDFGDLEAAYLAAAILKEIEQSIGNAS